MENGIPYVINDGNPTIFQHETPYDLKTRIAYYFQGDVMSFPKNISRSSHMINST